MKWFKKTGKAGPSAPDVGRLPWLTCQRLNVLLARLVVFLVLALFVSIWWHQTHPVIQEKTKFVQFLGPGQSYVRIVDADRTAQSNEMLIDQAVRAYVAAREPIDKTTEADRYRTVRLMSSDQVWADFRSKYGGKASILYQRGFKREVEIVGATRVAEGVYQVEYETLDYNEQDQADVEALTTTGDPRRGRRTDWIATLTYDFDNGLAIPESDAWRNPLKMTVTEYTITKRSN